MEGRREDCKSVIPPGFKPGSPACKTGMLITTPRQLILHDRDGGRGGGRG